MGEGHVVWWDKNRAFWSKLHSPCLEEEEGWVEPQENHPNREAWRWKHHSLGMLFCKGDRTTAPYWGEDRWGHVSRDLGQQPPSLSKGIPPCIGQKWMACLWHRTNYIHIVQYHPIRRWFMQSDGLAVIVAPFHRSLCWLHHVHFVMFFHYIIILQVHVHLQYVSMCIYHMKFDLAQKCKIDWSDEHRMAEQW